MNNNIPNKFYFINTFKKKNIDKLDSNTGVIFRNYKSNMIIKDIIQVRDYCSKKNIRFYLSNNFKLALKLKLDGAYIPSFYKNFRHLNYNTRKSFLVIGSAHNVKEIRLKEVQKVQLLFISSLFKKNKNFLGLYKFKILQNLTTKKVIALGGISKENRNIIRLLNCFGFSGISYFEKKKGPI